MNPDPNPDTLVKNVLVLLSGGQDSTTCLFWAKRTYPEAAIHALTVFYGQRHQAEVGAACEIALRAGCATHDVVDLSPVFEGAYSALAGGGKLALLASGGFKDDAMPEGLPTSFVPGRNLVFLAVAAARAGSYRCGAIVTGVCMTDYSGYPDCRSEFVAAMERAINQAMPTELQPVMVDAPLMYRTKAATVQLAKELPGCLEAIAYSVTCYNGLRPGCGTCPACELRAKGFAEGGIADPACVGEPSAAVSLVKRARPSEALKTEQKVIAAHGEPTPQNDAAIGIATILWPLAFNERNHGDFVVRIGKGTLEVAVPDQGYAYNLADEESKLPDTGIRMDADSLAELAERAGVAEYVTADPNDGAIAGTGEVFGDGEITAVETPTGKAAELAPHQQRVIDEHAELAGKLERLTAFLGAPTFARLDPAEQARLSRQASLMAGYQSVLGERIAAFKVSS